MKMGDLVDRVKGGPSTPSVAPSTAASVPQSLKWLLLDSKLLDGEHVLVVFEKRWLTEARQAYPGTVIYFPPEVEDAPSFGTTLPLGVIGSGEPRART